MTIIHADCLEAMRGMDDNSVTTIVTDPPYAVEFMGKGWDKVLPSDEIWREALRVLKPGGMALVFGGTRTFHRLTCSLEDAGFQIRDVLCCSCPAGDQTLPRAARSSTSSRGVKSAQVSV